MKRFYKKFFLIICVACLCFLLCGCFYSYEETTDGKFSFGVSKTKKDAFCIACHWDGGDKSFAIPDEYMGYQVTTLGGYTGRGYPCPFAVQIDLAKVYSENDTYGEVDDISEYDAANDDYDVLTFSVHLGANLVNLNYIHGKTYFVRHTEKDNGEIEDDIICKIVYSFTVDNENPKLYAENGKLYFRENDQLVTDFFYE